MLIGFFTRKLNNSAKTLQVIKPLLIEVYIVANANGTGLVRVHIYAPNFEEIDRAYWFRVVRVYVRPSVCSSRTVHAMVLKFHIWIPNGKIADIRFVSSPSYLPFWSYASLKKSE